MFHHYHHHLQVCCTGCPEVDLGTTRVTMAWTIWDDIYLCHLSRKVIIHNRWGRRQPANTRIMTTEWSWWQWQSVCGLADKTMNWIDSNDNELTCTVSDVSNLLVSGMEHGQISIIIVKRSTLLTHLLECGSAWSWRASLVVQVL